MKRLQGLLMIGISLIMIGLSITSDYIGDKDCTAAIMLLVFGVWLIFQKKGGKTKDGWMHVFQNHQKRQNILPMVRETKMQNPENSARQM